MDCWGGVQFDLLLGRSKKRKFDISGICNGWNGPL
jgi:hypothetical protein